MTPAEKKDDGGPAFPYDVQRNGRGYHDGMSLRDWFAGQALAGFLPRSIYDDTSFPQAAIDAYGYADAMLAERSK